MRTGFGQLLRHHRRRAGLSQAAVAAIAGWGNDASKVSRAERSVEPVLAAARTIIRVLDERLHFTRDELKELANAYLLPDTAAGAQGSSLLIGLSVPRVDESAFWSKVVGAIETEAASRGYLIVLCQHDEDVTMQCNRLDYFQELSAMAGMIVAPAVGITPTHHQPQLSRRFDDTLADVLRRDIPLIFVDRRVPTHHQIPYVGLDNMQAGRDAVNALLRRGHRKIGALFALKHSSTQQERHEGFKEVLIARGLYNPDLVKFGVEVVHDARHEQRARDGIRQGRRNALELLRLPVEERPTAIFCGTYYMALEALKALRELETEGIHLSVPQDVSIIGFDRVADLDLPQPNITRMEYPVASLARAAVEKLGSLIENPRDKTVLQDVKLTARLLERESVGRPPS